MRARDCTVFWGTREEVQGVDSHLKAHYFEISRMHTCMFVVGTYHPDKHECGTCHDWIDAKEGSNG